VGEAGSDSMSLVRVLHLLDSSGSLQLERWAKKSGSELSGVLTQRKSTLMTRLTGTHSEVSEIEFTTLTTVPGTLKVHGAPIQILDLRTQWISLPFLQV